ncbi:MAG TPA: PspC domain-containing protein [Candidatus Limnocylindrales bacterium]|nr:PspC domain-containing protein [Candidatus Limnocylindrales bacterium]
MIGGVAGGIADNLSIDPTIVRVGWVVLTLATNGALLLVYFLLLFLLPEAPEAPGGSEDADRLARPDGSETGTSATAAAFGPARPMSRPWARPSRSTADGRSGAVVVGAILVLVGGYFLIRQYLPSIDLRLSWPFVAIGLGVVLIVAALRPSGRSG